MSKKTLDKKHSQRWHFKWKLKERYGIFCNKDVYFYLLDQVKQGKSECLLKQSNTRILHKVYLPLCISEHYQTNITVPVSPNGIKIYVVYDAARGELCTALPWYATDEELLSDYEKYHKYVRWESE